MQKSLDRKRILAIGDSLALPGHGNMYQDTWYYLLKQKYPNYDFITVFRRGVTTNILTTAGEEFDVLEYYIPNIVILQLGIVDCAPRLFKKNGVEKLILNRMPEVVKNNYIAFVKKHRVRHSKRAEVSPDMFLNNLNLYLMRCKKNNVSNIIIIAIPFPDERMIKISPNIINSVNLYNNIYNKLAKSYKNVSVIYPLDSRLYKHNIFEDGYHPNQVGHNAIFFELKEILNNCQK